MREFKSYNAGVMYNINRPLLLLGVEVQWVIVGFLLVVVGTLINVLIGVLFIGALVGGLSIVAKKRNEGYSDYVRSTMQASGRPEVITNEQVIGVLKIRRS